MPDGLFGPLASATLDQPLIVDLFAGIGGASAGIKRALRRAPDVAIDHDPSATSLHAAAHPETAHYCRSVYDVSPHEAIGGHRRVGLLWASPDCRHHSRAAGGRVRSRSVRDLAWVVVEWARRVRPAVILVENVSEFADWGPLKPCGQPCPDRRGSLFEHWRQRLRRLGYRVETKRLRACDFGGATIRERLFVQARCDGQPIRWPEPTHGDPDGAAVRSGRLRPWRTAADIIDWSIPCPSIFERSRLLADATCRRIARGVMKYVVTAADPFIVPVTHAGDARVHGIADPLRTVTAANRGELALVSACLASLRDPADGRTIDRPMPTVAASGEHVALMSACLTRTDMHRSNATCIRPLDRPVPTATTSGGIGLVSACLATVGYSERDGQSPRVRSVTDPTTTVPASGGKQALVAAFLAQHNLGRVGRQSSQPLATVTTRGTQTQLVTCALAEATERAREVAAFLTRYHGSGQQDRTPADPLGTVDCTDRYGLVTVTIEGTPHAVVDIGMRMLTPRELARAQGFPDATPLEDVHGVWRTDGGALKQGIIPRTYQIAGIGNSVHVDVAAALVAAACPDLAERDPANGAALCAEAHHG